MLPLDLLLETLLDFENPAQVDSWEVIGDRVMGGRSIGRLTPLESGWALFSGEVLLTEGAGFASVRSARGLFDLSPFDGIFLQVRGDGRRYGISLRIDPWADTVAYQARFDTRAGERTDHRIPLSEFRPTWRGRPVPGAPPLEPSRVTSFGLVIADRREGPFRLEFSSIRAYRTPGNSRRAPGE